MPTRQPRTLVPVLFVWLCVIGGKPSTAALGMVQTDGSHANFGMIQLDAKYEAIRGQALDLIKTRYKPEPVKRPAGRVEESGKQEDERLFPFREPGEQPRWGYMNRKGEVVIQPEYLMAHDFFEGKAQVQTPGRIVYLDKQGQRVCSAPSVAYTATRFSDGLARFSVTVPYRSSDPDADPSDSWRVKWGYFDATGKVVIEPKFDDARDFSDGLARVNVGATPQPQGWGVLGGEWGFIDRSGKWVVKPGDIVAVEDFSEGLGLVHLQKEHTWAFVNKKGEIAFKLPRYWPGDERAGSDDPDRDTASRLHIRSVASFSEGLARVRYADGVIEFLDRTGKRVISPCPQGLRDFSEGLAILSDGEKFGYVDRKGEWVIPPQFESVRPFSEGLAAVRTEKTWKYIDKQGKVAFVPSLPDDVPGPVNVAGNFSGGLARVHAGGDEETIFDVSLSWLGGGAWYYLNRRGEIVRRMGKDGEVPSEMHLRAMVDADRYRVRQGKDVKRIREDGQSAPRSAY